jgi:hypothetical protein
MDKSRREWLKMKIVDSSINRETRMFRRGDGMYMMRPVDGRVKAGKDRVFRERIASVGKFYNNVGRRVVRII